MNTKQCRDEEAGSGYQIVQSRLSFWLHRPMHWRSPLVFAWGIVGIYLIADLILLPVSRLTLASSTAWYLLYPALVVGVVACVLQAIRYRLRSDSTKIARLLVAAADGFGLVAYGCLFMWAFAIVSITFSYLSTSFSLPLRDADIAMIDRAVGFDWPGFLAWTNRQPLIAEALKTSYHTSGLQLLLVFLFLSFSRRREWLSEFIAIFAISSLLTGLGMTLMPAEGAYAYYHPTADQFSGYSPDAGMWHHKILIALRMDAAPVLDFSQLQGLVTFPSFHTVLAVIISYAMRVSRILATLTIPLNCIVIAGTITEGGHHLTDVIAGGFIAVFAILCVRRMSVATLSPARMSPACPRYELRPGLTI